MDGDILHILNDTQFGQKLRGYDPLEVDEVLDAAIEEIKTLRSKPKPLPIEPHGRKNRSKAS